MTEAKLAFLLIILSRGDAVVGFFLLKFKDLPAALGFSVLPSEPDGRRDESGGGVRWRDANDGPFHPRMDARGPTGYQTPQICVSRTLGASHAAQPSLIRYLAETARSALQIRPCALRRRRRAG